MSEEPNVSGATMEAAAPVTEQPMEVQAEQQQQSTQVPLAALQSERAHRQQLQDELKVIKDHLALMQAQQTRAPQPQAKDEFNGLSDDDVMTVGDYKKLTGKYAQQFQTSLAELRMQQKYSDYQQVVTKYLPEVIKNNPGLRTTLEATQDYELAYYLAKNSDSYRNENKQIQRNADAERIVQNANKAGNLSSMGQVSPISQAKRYKDMSEDEFRKVVNKNLGYS
jgi:hypothetical protein